MVATGVLHQNTTVFHTLKMSFIVFNPVIVTNPAVGCLTFFLIILQVFPINVLGSMMKLEFDENTSITQLLKWEKWATMLSSRSNLVTYSLQPKACMRYNCLQMLHLKIRSERVRPGSRLRPVNELGSILYSLKSGMLESEDENEEDEEDEEGH